MKRLLFRLRLLLSGVPWRHSRYIDHRQPSSADIKRSLDLAEKYGLLNPTNKQDKHTTQ